MFNDPQVILFSENVERSATFFSGLGFVEIFRVPETGAPIHVDMVLDGYEIEVASVESTRADHGLDPVAHGQRAAVILWTDDVDTAYESTAAAGSPGIPEPHIWLDRLGIAWLADPDVIRFRSSGHSETTLRARGLWFRQASVEGTGY